MQDIINDYYIESPTIGKDWEDWMLNNDEIRKYVGKTSIALYSKYMDSVVNFGIRNKRLSEIGYIIYRRIMSLINKAHNNPETFYLFRGVRDNEKLKLYSMKIGDTFSDPGFSSRTTSPEIVNTFAGYNCCAIVVKYEANTQPFIFTDDDSFDGNGNAFLESEYLTYPGEVLKIEDIQTISFAYSNIKTYICSIDRINFDNIQSYVDTTIDEEFKVFYNILKNNFDYYDIISMKFMNKTYFIFKDLDSLAENSVVSAYLDNIINLDDDLYSIYSKFFSGYIKDMVGIMGIKDVNIFIGDEYKYLENGNIVTKIIKTKEHIKAIYRGLLMGNIRRSDIVHTKLSIDASPSNFTNYIEDISDSPIMLEEFRRLEYDDDIYNAMYNIYSFDPVFYKYFKNTSDTDNYLESIITRVQKEDPIKIATEIGMIIPPKRNKRKYFLKNVTDYIVSGENQMNILNDYGYYYPSTKFIDSLFKHETINDRYFIPLLCNGKTNIKIVDASPVFIDKPIIAYGNYKKYICYTLEELKYTTDFELQDIISIMGL